MISPYLKNWFHTIQSELQNKNYISDHYEYIYASRIDSLAQDGYENYYTYDFNLQNLIDDTRELKKLLGASNPSLKIYWVISLTYIISEVRLETNPIFWLGNPNWHMNTLAKNNPPKIIITTDSKERSTTINRFAFESNIVHSSLGDDLCVKYQSYFDEDVNISLDGCGFIREFIIKF
ncbi:MAG: hypothetical protein H7230_01455 [Candidatus Parcubacteria bacterium]|nr:hypothetical protein [Candidatus Paceibacterota bacterium]